MEAAQPICIAFSNADVSKSEVLISSNAIGVTGGNEGIITIPRFAGDWGVYRIVFFDKGLSVNAIVWFWVNSKAKICTQQIYVGAIYKDCNDLPVGESAIAFRTALHKPQNDDSIWFIFCMGAPSDGIKYQVAIQYLYPLVVKTRTWNSTNEVWNDWK